MRKGRDVMARKRPSLRNYLIDGDQVRDVLPIIDPPPNSDEVSISAFVEGVLSACPLGRLDPSTWAVAVAARLMELKDKPLSLFDLKGAFQATQDDEIVSVLERAVSLKILSLGDDGEVNLNSPSSWSLELKPASSWIDDLAAIMVEDDKNMWLPLLSQSSLASLDIDSVKTSFNSADPVSDQFFMMRKAGEALLPITRQSQIRLPLVAVIKWSEKGNSTVFFGDAS